MLAKKDINRSTLLGLLTSEEYLRIVFKKSTTQTIRTMVCTLYWDSIPSNYAKTITAIIEDNTNLDVIPVWEITQGRWKSFHISNIISVNIEEKKKKED